MFLIAAMFFAGLFTYCYGQDVKVNINNQDYSSNGDCDFKIQGICSSEDIGGVDVQGLAKYIYDNVYEYYTKTLFLVFTNYNSFPVTVLFQGGSRYTHIISTVLKTGETKEIEFEALRGNYSKPYPSEPYDTTMDGMIVRKMGQ